MVKGATGGPTGRGWAGWSVGRRENGSDGRRHAPTTGGSDHTQVALGWIIRSVEGGA